MDTPEEIYVVFAPWGPACACKSENVATLAARDCNGSYTKYVLPGKVP